MPITSPNNEQLKQVRKLAGRKWRDKTRTFVAEGEDLIAAAAAAGWRPELLLCEAGSGLEGEEVAPHLLRQVSQLGSGTRALAVYPQRWAPAPAGPVCVALWGVNDPGNVGTVLRSALAFGAGSVALGPGTADPYGHKAVRASMGAIFDVPVVRVARVEELPGRKVALAARAGRALAELERGGGDARGRRRARGAAARGAWRRATRRRTSRSARSRSTPRWRRRSVSTRSQVGWRAHEGEDRAAPGGGHRRDRRGGRHRRARGGADRLPRPQGRAAEPAARRRRAGARGARRGRPRRERGAQGARGRGRGAPRRARARRAGRAPRRATPSTSRCPARPPCRSGGCT